MLSKQAGRGWNGTALIIRLVLRLAPVETGCIYLTADWKKN